MNKKIIASLASLCLFGASLAALAQFNPSDKAGEITLSNQNKTASVGSGLGWHTLPMGGGGWLYAVWGVCDQGPKACSPGVGTVTEMVHTDVGGTGYWYNRSSTGQCTGNQPGRTSGCWQAILTPVNMPGTTSYGALSSMRTATVSASNTSIAWVYFGQNGCLYKSTTGPGGTYSQPAGWTCTGYQETNIAGTSCNPMSLADPYNANVMYVSVSGGASTNVGHAFRTLNGGTTFPDLSTLSIANSSNGGPCTTIFAFDISPATPTVACPTGGSGSCTTNVFVLVNGTGIYKSKDGGATFTLLNTTGMPGGGRHIEVDRTGTVYVDDGGYPPNIYKWIPSGPNSTTGTWSVICSSCGGGGDPVAAIAVDPNTACTLASQNCHLAAVTFNGIIYESFNSGGAWQGNNHYSFTAVDAPWLSVDVEGIQPANMYFDPTRNDVVVVAGGDAIWDATLPGNTTSSFVWNSRTTDIQELVITNVAAPPGFNPVAGGWDRGAWSLTSLTQFPSTYQHNVSVPGSRAYSINYTNNFTGTGPGAQTGGRMIFMNLGGCSGCTGGFYSANFANGDPTNYSIMTSVPSEMSATGPCGCYSGFNLTGFDNNNWLWLVGQQGDLFGTTNGGASWTKLAAGNVPTGGVAATTVASGTGTTLTFGGGLDAALVASINAGNATSAGTTQTAANQWCGLGSIASATSTTITLSAPAACSVGSGDWVKFYTDTGWTTGGEGYPTILVADRASTNRAYIANGNASRSGAAGIYKISVSGGTYNVVQVYSGTPTTPTMYQNAGAMLTVPSTPGDIYFSNAGGSSINTSWMLAECIDSNPTGTASGTMSCSTVQTTSTIPGTSTHYGVNVSMATAMAAGRPKAGGSGYSAIYCYCAVNGSYGVWQTYDHFQTATQIGGSMFEGCGNAGICNNNNGDMFTGRFDSLTMMAASPDTQGLVFACWRGVACLYGQFN